MSPSKTPPAKRGRWARAFGRRGVAASEFALVAPLFALILLATADVIRVFRAQIRMEMIAVQIGQIVSQCTRITTPGDTNEFWGHATRIGAGLVDVTAQGSMILSATSLDTVNNRNRLDWQVRTGNFAARSTLGTIQPGGEPTVRGRNGAAFLLPRGQTMMVFEANAVVIPWRLSVGLIGTVLPREINGMTMFLSRSADPARLQTPPVQSAARECT
jgi:hypothetical protein